MSNTSWDCTLNLSIVPSSHWYVFNFFMEKFSRKTYIIKLFRSYCLLSNFEWREFLTRWYLAWYVNIWDSNFPDYQFTKRHSMHWFQEMKLLIILILKVFGQRYIPYGPIGGAYCDENSRTATSKTYSNFQMALSKCQQYNCDILSEFEVDSRWRLAAAKFERKTTDYIKIWAWEICASRIRGCMCSGLQLDVH